MKHLGELIGHFTIKDNNNNSLFKVYFYEKGISFDKKFLRGVIENKKAYKTFMKINDDWEQGESRVIVMKSIQDMVERHGEYFNNFFSLEEDFENEKDFEDEEGFENKEDFEDYSTELYLKYLNANDKLIEITRKKFESKIIKEEIGEFYVKILNDTRDISKFYTYKSETTNKEFFVMLVDEKIKIGFAEE